MDKDLKNLIRESSKTHYPERKGVIGYFPIKFAVGWITIMCFCILVSFFSYQVIGINSLKAAGNFKNPIAVQEVLTGKISEANAAWWGFDSNDATEALQSAINSGAAKVIVPYTGSDWITRPIKLVSNQEIVFEPGVVVIAKEDSFRGKYDCLFSARHLSNVTLRGYGAVLRMRKNDYKSPKYIKSEHRHIIELRSSNNVNIFGLRLESSGGDGIFVGYKGGSITAETAKYTYAPCKNVLIRDCICDNNYRQGISVISVDKLRVDNCVLKNTRGTLPQAGIDLEPGLRGVLSDIVISNCISENNAGQSFVVNIGQLKATSREISILFINCYARNCTSLAVYAKNPTNQPKGLIEFRNCVIEDMNIRGLDVFWEKVGCPMKLQFIDCKWRNVAKMRRREPLRLIVKSKKAASQTEGIEFVNCHVYDEHDRPFMRIMDYKGGEDVYDIKGGINVHNPYGAKIDLRPAGKKLALKVNFFKTQK